MSLQVRSFCRCEAWPKKLPDTQLGEMLTAVLSIPLTEVLPTPNARKTCALSIWLLQVQRLPEEVLIPARVRIAFALRRGMEGELGKEGKKGSACDGLKVGKDILASVRCLTLFCRQFMIFLCINPQLSYLPSQSYSHPYWQTYSRQLCFSALKHVTPSEVSF